MAKFYVARRTLVNSYLKDGLFVKRLDGSILGLFIKRYLKDIKAVVASTTCFHYGFDDGNECFDEFIEGIDLDTEKLKVSILSTDKCNLNPQEIILYVLTDNSDLQSSTVIQADFDRLEEMANSEGIFFNHMKVIWKEEGFDIGN